jgi:hypothetical protein
MQVVTAVGLREHATVSARVVARLAPGTTGTLLRQRDNGYWVEVKVGGQTGWAYKSFFQRIADGETAPVEPASSNVDTPGDEDAPLAAPHLHLDEPLTPPAVARQPRREDWVRAPHYALSSAAPPAGALGVAPVPTERYGDPMAVARSAPTHERHQLELLADVGVDAYSRRYLSNGSRALASYELSTSAAASGAEARYRHRSDAGRLLGVDFSYLYSAGGSVRYVAGDGTATKLGMQIHDVEAGLRLGLHLRVAHGLDLWLRGGAMFQAVLFDPIASLRVQSTRLIAPTVGVGLDAPRLLALAGHWLELQLLGQAIIAGHTVENLDEGPDLGSWGAQIGGRFLIDVWTTATRGRLALTGGYSYGFTSSRFRGVSQRDSSATEATLGSTEQVATLAICYRY